VHDSKITGEYDGRGWRDRDCASTEGDSSTGSETTMREKEPAETQTTFQHLTMLRVRADIGKQTHLP